jgi:hypothetical protein
MKKSSDAEDFQESSSLEGDSVSLPAHYIRLVVLMHSRTFEP